MLEYKKVVHNLVIFYNHLVLHKYQMATPLSYYEQTEKYNIYAKVVVLAYDIALVATI